MLIYFLYFYMMPFEFIESDGFIIGGNMKRLVIVTVMFAAIAITGCGGGGDSLQPPKVDLTGIWEISETITQANSVCAEALGETSTYTLEAVQNGNNLTVTVGDDAPENPGTVFTGTVSGDQINWSGSYPTSGGTTNITGTNITANNSEFSGTANWTWSGDGESCEGQTQVQGYKMP
jgi:hypothetical protein